MEEEKEEKKLRRGGREKEGGGEVYLPLPTRRRFPRMYIELLLGLLKVTFTQMCPST